MAKRNPKKTNVRSILKRSLLPAMLLIVVAFFGSYAVFGPNGALAYGDIQHRLSAQQKQLVVLDAKREELRNRVALLNPNHADIDMADEQARKQLNVVRPNEVILKLQ